MSSGLSLGGSGAGSGAARVSLRAAKGSREKSSWRHRGSPDSDKSPDDQNNSAVHAESDNARGIRKSN